MVVAALVLMVALQLFVGRTRLGRAMRSTAQDREAAELMGVDINQTIAITFFIAAALAGAAGVIQGLYFGSIQFNLGFYAGLKAFTAAVLGGIGNTTGAATGWVRHRLHRGARRAARLLAVVARRPSSPSSILSWSSARAGILGQPLGERA